MKMIHPTVLKKPAEQTTNRNILTQSLNPRDQATNPPNDQVHLHSSLRGGIHCLNGLGINQGIYLDQNTGDLSFLGRLSFLLNHTYHFRMQIKGGNQNLFKSGFAGVSG